MASNKSVPKEILEHLGEIDDVSIDYDFSRDKYREILELGAELLPEAIKIAKDSEHPRAFEVAFNGMRQLADINDKLLNMQRKKQVLDKDTNGSDSPPALGHVTDGDGESSVYEGTTSQLLSQITSEIQDAEIIESQERKSEES